MGTSSSRSSYSTILLDISEAKKRLGGKWKSYGKLYPGSDGNFEKFLNDVAPTFPKYLRRVLFNAFDTNGSGVVLAQEFISGIAIVINGTREEKSRFLFAGYDLDRAGRLSKRQFTSIIKHLNKNEEQNNNKLIHKILDRIEDKNISEAVFCEFVKRFEKQQFVMWIEVFRKCLIEKVSSRSITAFQSLWTPRDTEEIALAKAYDSLRDSSDMGVLDLKTLRFYLKSFDDENASETLMRYMNPTTKSSGISKRQFVNSLKPWILQEEEKSTKMNKLLNFTNKDTILCWRTIVHVEFGVLPLHKNLEALVIRTCQRNNDKSSQKKKFIISLTWWNKWIEYTEKNSNERPSKINNRRISRKNCVIVSERVWIALSSWYVDV
jgi:Ca2+-binding EF-hand superfamily protein